ncbi:MAG: hypothetical protein QXK88_02215 [Desulfurococcaceae archaeon]
MIKHNAKTILSVISLTVILLSLWISWEAVVKPLKSMVPASWNKDFPSPFYLWDAPIWWWHDLYITLIVVFSVVLCVLSLIGREEVRKAG